MAKTHAPIFRFVPITAPVAPTPAEAPAIRPAIRAHYDRLNALPKWQVFDTASGAHLGDVWRLRPGHFRPQPLDGRATDFTLPSRKQAAEWLGQAQFAPIADGAAPFADRPEGPARDRALDRWRRLE